MTGWVDDLEKIRPALDIKDARIEDVRFHPKDFRDENPLVWEIKTTGIPLIRPASTVTRDNNNHPLNFRKVVNYWREATDEDWKMVEYLLTEKRYSYALAFARTHLEKLLKAAIVYQTHLHSPFRCSLLELAERAGLDLTPKERSLLARVNTHIREEFDHPDAVAITRKHTRRFTNGELKATRQVGEQLASMLESSKCERRTST